MHIPAGMPSIVQTFLEPPDRLLHLAERSADVVRIPDFRDGDSSPSLRVMHKIEVEGKVYQVPPKKAKKS
jgi:hypothetical protein